jgi:hypothetical protein
MRGSRKRAVHNSPLPIDNDCIPEVVWAGHYAYFWDFSGRLQIPSNHLGVDSNGSTHLHHKDCNFFGATSLGLDYSPWVNVAVKSLFPSDLLADPGEDGS